jgi:formamidopyrimidine-DNA glycosylase
MKQAGGAGVVSLHIDRAKITAPQAPALVESLVRETAIRGIRRRGKQVLIDLANGRTVRVHLGMTGDLFVADDYRFRPHTTRAWFHLAGDRALIFNDPRALGHLNVYTETELEAVLGHLGVEPFSSDFTVETMRRMVHGSRLPIKVFLMDQTRIAGLGNIYAAEALFQAAIHPERPAGKLRAIRLARLHEAIVNVLADALQSAGTAYVRPGEFQEAEAFQPQVYGRESEPCTRCRRKVRRVQQGGRSTYFCPGCQT